MTSEEVQDIIRIEIENEKDFFNPHSVDLNKCLIKPIKQIYLDPLNNETKYELWTVLEETPDGKGYKIFYSEEEQAFGLGVKTKNNELGLIGIYGPFINTLSAM